MLQLKNSLRFSLLIVLVLIVVSKNAISQNIFTDKTNQKIWEAKDRSDVFYTNSIFKSGTKDQKILALKGLESWQDSSLRDPLLKLVKKGNTDVKIAALEAIGQSRDSFYIPYLLKIINHKRKAKLKPAALVALGKCITKSKVGKLEQIENVNQLGFDECIYRAMLKGVSSQSLTDKMVERLGKNNSPYADWYIARTPYSIVLSENFKTALYYFYGRQYDPIFSLPLLTIFGKVKVDQEDSFQIRKIFDSFFVNKFKLDDIYLYLNLVSIYKTISINKLDFNSQIFKLSFLNSKIVYPSLELAQSELISKNCKSLSEYPSFTYSPAIVNILKNSDCKNFNIKLPITNTIYDKIWNLQLLENSYYNYAAISTILMQTEQPAVKSAAMESLIKCRNSKGFPDNLISDFNETVAILIKDADEGALSIIANAILEKQITLEPNYKDLLVEAQAKLQLPQEMEAYIDITKVLAMINKTVYKKPETEWNHPINWEYVVKIKTDQKIKVTTNKGEFIIQMNVNEAPGSVSSILKLVEDGFYNGKYFHRMVPNFVVQGGCPRGDGFGGVNYTVRSEFSSLKYSTGAVGLASSGPDTESCQWFVTHCPTPHLDGRYTIIGYVIEGMEIIHKLGVGDRMIKVERI